MKVHNFPFLAARFSWLESQFERKTSGVASERVESDRENGATLNPDLTHTRVTDGERFKMHVNHRPISTVDSNHNAQLCGKPKKKRVDFSLNRKGSMRVTAHLLASLELFWRRLRIAHSHLPALAAFSL